jgi:hypothetical protein
VKKIQRLPHTPKLDPSIRAGFKRLDSYIVNDQKETRNSFSRAANAIKDTILQQAIPTLTSLTYQTARNKGDISSLLHVFPHVLASTAAQNGLMSGILNIPNMSKTSSISEDWKEFKNKPFTEQAKSVGLNIAQFILGQELSRYLGKLDRARQIELRKIAKQGGASLVFGSIPALNIDKVTGNDPAKKGSYTYAITEGIKNLKRGAKDEDVFNDPDTRGVFLIPDGSGRALIEIPTDQYNPYIQTAYKLGNSYGVNSFVRSDLMQAAFGDKYAKGLKFKFIPMHYLTLGGFDGSNTLKLNSKRFLGPSQSGSVLSPMYSRALSTVVHEGSHWSQKEQNIEGGTNSPRAAILFDPFMIDVNTKLRDYVKQHRAKTSLGSQLALSVGQRAEALDTAKQLTDLLNKNDPTEIAHFGGQEAIKNLIADELADVSNIDLARQRFVSKDPVKAAWYKSLMKDADDYYSQNIEEMTKLYRRAFGELLSVGDQIGFTGKQNGLDYSNLPEPLWKYALKQIDKNATPLFPSRFIHNTF